MTAAVPSRRSARIALSLFVLLLFGALALLWTSDDAHGTLGPVRGLRLGAAPSLARAQLDTDGPGSFRAMAMGEDFAIVWTPAGATGDLRGARMEFHLGQLVALRLSLSRGAREAAGPPLEISAGSVLARDSTPDGVALTWLARGCPTHADEVRRRIAER